MKKNPALAKAPAKAAPKPPAKGAKEEKPVIDVPKIPVPQVTEFKSEMGNQYVRERQYIEIAQKLMEPPKEDEEEKKKDVTEKEAAAIALATQVAAAEQKPATTDSNFRKSTDTLQSEPSAEPPFKPNDYL